MYGYSSNNSVASTSPRSKFLAMGLSSLETIPKRVRPIVKADEFNFNLPPTTLIQSNQYKSNNNEYNTNLLQDNQAISNQNEQNNTNNQMYNYTTNTTIPPEILRHQYTDFQKKIIAEQFSGNYKHQLSSPKRLHALQSGVDYEGCLFSNNSNNSSCIGSNSKYINQNATTNYNTATNNNVHSRNDNNYNIINNNTTNNNNTTASTTTNNNNTTNITINNNHNNNNSNNTEYLDFHSKMEASLPPPLQQTRKPYNRNLNTPNNNNTQYIGLQIGSYSDNNTIKRKKLESQNEYARLLQDDINIKSVTKKRQECNGRLNLLDDACGGSGSYVGSIGNSGSNSVVIDGGGEQRRQEAQVNVVVVV